MHSPLVSFQGDLVNALESTRLHHRNPGFVTREIAFLKYQAGLKFPVFRFWRYKLWSIPGVYLQREKAPRRGLIG